MNLYRGRTGVDARAYPGDWIKGSLASRKMLRVE
jgi:hypothetical protein